jgi:hypothetical protein
VLSGGQVVNRPGRCSVEFFGDFAVREESRMNREDLVTLCERFAGRRTGLFMGRIRLEGAESMVDPMPEILRSFRRAEISESEKNALLALVSDPEDDGDVCGEPACVLDPYADEQATDSDDDVA